MSAMDSVSLLFNRGELTEALRVRRVEALRQVNQWEGEELLRIPAAEVIDAIVAGHALADMCGFLPPFDTVAGIVVHEFPRHDRHEKLSPRRRHTTRLYQ